MYRNQNILLPEAQEFVDIGLTESHDDVLVYARALRSSTIAGKLRSENDLDSRRTNCLGVNLHLQALIDPIYKPVMGAVLRFGWQSSNDHSGIHLVTITEDPTSGDQFLTDPMPAAGYMYGTQGQLIKKGHDDFGYFDKAVSSECLIRQLTATEVAAIGLHYFAKGHIETDRSKALDLATEATRGLSRVPGYLARNHLLIDMIHGDSAYSELNHLAPLEGIRSSQASLLTDKYKQAILRERNYLMEAETKRHIEVAANLWEQAENPYIQNYWGGVREELSLGFTAMNALKHASLSHEDFNEPRPIAQYESYILNNHRGYCRSDLYNQSSLEN